MATCVFLILGRPSKFKPFYSSAASDVFKRQGYALRAEVSATGPGGFTVSLTGPCNLWALRALGSRGAAVVNAYDVLALDSWLRASGRSAAVELELTESGVNETWTLMA